ncbi:MAG: ribosome silencing factor, partial [Dehalococcoidia bacterium]
MDTQTTYKNKVQTAIELALDSGSEFQAEDIIMMDVSESCAFADYFILMTANSPRHMRAISEDIESHLKNLGLTLHHREGDQNSGWYLLDYGDLVIHLFAREH